MIKANELRIGNFLKDQQSGEILIVDELTATGIATIVLDRSKYPLKEGWQAVPIPLTPEELEKCGFENKLSIAGFPTGLYQKNGLDIGYSGDDIVLDQYSARFKSEGLFVKVKYLHQLQNLYYALTGEELEYKP